MKLLFIVLEHVIYLQVSRTFPVLVQVLAWLPAATALLFSAISFLKAMFNSQVVRITSALKGAKGDIGPQLGFMDKIKYEVGFTLCSFKVAFQMTSKISMKVFLTQTLFKKFARNEFCLRQAAVRRSRTNPRKHRVSTIL